MKSFLIIYLLMGQDAFSMRSDLELSVSEGLLLKTPEKDEALEKNNKSSRIMGHREHFTRNLVSISYRPYLQTINYTEDSVNGNFDLSAASGMGTSIEWAHHSFNRLQLITGLDISLMDFSEDVNLKANSLAFPSERLFGFYAGARYFLSERWSIFSKLSFSQSHYVNFRKINNQPSPVLSRFTLPRYHLGVEGSIYKSAGWRFLIESKLLGIIGLAKSLGQLEVSGGVGFYGDLAFKYWATNLIWIRTALYLESFSANVKGEGYTAGQGSTFSGAKVEFGIRL